MPCGCLDATCSCFLADTNTVSVTGSGTSGDPYTFTTIPAGNGGLQNGATGVGILLDPDACNLLTLSNAGLLANLVTANSGSVTFSGCGTLASPLSAVSSGGGGGGEFLPGMMMPWAGTGAPADWALVDGANIDSIADPTYAALFTVIGTTYGGTGPADFYLPDTRGRTLIGEGLGVGEDSAGAAGTFPAGAALTARLRGQWGGSQDVALSVNNLATHSHSSPAHVHDITHQHGATSTEDINAAWNETPVEDYGNPGGDNTSPSTVSGKYQVVAGRTIATGGTGLGNVFMQGADHQHSTALFSGNSGGANGDATTGVQGLGTAHANVQPFVVVNYIIKL